MKKFLSVDLPVRNHFHTSECSILSPSLVNAWRNFAKSYWCSRLTKSENILDDILSSYFCSASWLNWSIFKQKKAKKIFFFFKIVFSEFATWTRKKFLENKLGIVSIVDQHFSRIPNCWETKEVPKVSCGEGSTNRVSPTDRWKACWSRNLNFKFWKH